eukprot:TRINITY_DN109529_c0_g1_i2.p1 TRINITY_DN109529_c0_g1~~TRINITY_DN109529_c0_g1_i2.p1  ORF type:complete len:252 (-),score=20.79 TRINITY_DN109529_c0_g1_i2:157-912(-)
MSFSAEPILDVVRGITTVVSFGIVADQLKNLWEEIFTDECENCRGTGLVTCQYCRSTKNLRKRPAQLVVRRLNYVDSPDDLYTCYHCGPTLQSDVNVENIEDDEQESMQIMNNFRALMANKKNPKSFGPTAGLVQCSMCKGNPVVRRHSPNWARLFELDGPWYRKIQMGTGRTYRGRQNRPDDVQRAYLEFPSTPPPVNDNPFKFRSQMPDRFKPRGASEDDDMAMMAKNQLSIDDFVLQYVDESDSDDEQ